MEEAEEAEEAAATPEMSGAGASSPPTKQSNDTVQQCTVVLVAGFAASHLLSVSA